MEKGNGEGKGNGVEKDFAWKRISGRRMGTMNLREIINNFCNLYQEYSYVEVDDSYVEVDDSCVEVDDSYVKVENSYVSMDEVDSRKRMPREKCCGIRISEGGSYMEMFIRLTEYLGRVGYEDTALELSNPAIDEVGGDIIVSFPYLCG